VAVPVGATLAKLDAFLRETWLECCGHLSSFEIAGERYASNPMDEDLSMKRPLKEVVDDPSPLAGDTSYPELACR
jgi:hypothetical protein